MKNGEPTPNDKEYMHLHSTYYVHLPLYLFVLQMREEIVSMRMCEVFRYSGILAYYLWNT